MKKPVEVSKKLALVQNGKMLTDYMFDILLHSNDKVFVFRGGNTVYWYTRDGELIRSIDNTQEISFSNNYNNDYVIIKKDNLYGIYSCDGEELLYPEYSNILVFKNSDHVILTKDGKKGIYSTKKRKFIIKIQFDNIKLDGIFFPFYEVEKDGKFGVYSYSGKRMIYPKYHKIVSLDYHDYFCVMDSNYKCALYKGRNKVSDFIYDLIRCTNIKGIIELKRKDKKEFYTIKDELFIQADDVCKRGVDNGIYFRKNLTWYTYDEIVKLMKNLKEAGAIWVEYNLTKK